MVKNVCIPLGKSVQYNSGDRLYLKKIESSKRGNESVDIKAVIRLGTANSQGHAVRRFYQKISPSRAALISLNDNDLLIVMADAGLASWPG